MDCGKPRGNLNGGRALVAGVYVPRRHACKGRPDNLPNTTKAHGVSSVTLRFSSRLPM